MQAARILVIDQIGFLSSVYRYASMAYIGGGFGAGIHNTLEAATFGLPLAFGPRYEAFKEAKELIAAGGAKSISTADELIQWFDPLFQEIGSSLFSCSTSVFSSGLFSPFPSLRLFPRAFFCFRSGLVAFGFSRKMRKMTPSAVFSPRTS